LPTEALAASKPTAITRTRPLVNAVMPE
jgi:hypothetical protein